MTAIIALVAVALVVVTGSFVVQLLQIRAFYKHLMAEIDRRYDQRCELISQGRDPNELPWLDAHLSWEKFDQLSYWSRDFDSCVVYYNEDTDDAL